MLPVIGPYPDRKSRQESKKGNQKSDDFSTVLCELLMIRPLKNEKLQNGRGGEIRTLDLLNPIQTR